MQNGDLIAFLKPVVSRFSTPDRVELLDVSGQVTDIEANSYRLCLRPDLANGLYRGRLETRAGAFDMTTASLEMVRVPDGKRVSIGPWDLDHLHNVMAMPMAKVWVNGTLKGGLWFAMPGPEEIADGRLFADFGFEARDGVNELVLELVERDRERMGWDRLNFLELRQDDRRLLDLLPANSPKPRLFVSAEQARSRASSWQGTPEFEELGQSLLRDDLVMLTDNSQGTLSLAILYWAMTGDAQVGERARAAVMEIANAKTWSGRPDPLLMGGENDRGISLRLFHVALAWEHLQPLLTSEDRSALRARAEEYLQKVYNFTVLQRAYMGYPAIDPHSLGSWNGPAIACMAFYDEVPVARQALPFFHGLFVDSLQLMPESGKAAWATYFPFHLVLYLAAAHTFAGQSPELSSSRFLDHLGQALLTSFESPNSQEMQRGLRTREHRFLTAYLHRFHPTPGVDAIYRAFVEREREATATVSLGIFDLLYAPDLRGPSAPISYEPLFAKDAGDILVTSRSTPRVSVSMSAGAKAGRKASFSLMPQNREFAPSLGALEVAVDGAPVLCNVNISGYGINSALTNAICLEDGGGVTNGQYLNGAVRPEQCSVLRRYLCGPRFLYAHVMLTGALHPKLEVNTAERVLLFDRETGIILLADAFSARRALRFATHLHCSGSAKEIEGALYRLTGGQADLVAGIKGGSKGLGNEERGELFVTVLRQSTATRVVVEEPTWIPGYIYGLNYTGHEELKDGKFPHYTRWRLEALERVRAGELVIALSPDPQVAPRMANVAEGKILLPHGGACLGQGTHTALGVTCDAECLLWDDETQRVTAIGATSLRHDARRLLFDAPVDLEYAVVSRAGQAFAASASKTHPEGFNVAPWTDAGKDDSRTLGRLCANFSASPDPVKDVEAR
jgi:hypothetical protein